MITIRNTSIDLLNLSVWSFVIAMSLAFAVFLAELLF